MEAKTMTPNDLDRSKAKAVYSARSTLRAPILETWTPVLNWGGEPSTYANGATVAVGGIDLDFASDPGAEVRIEARLWARDGGYQLAQEWDVVAPFRAGAETVMHVQSGLHTAQLDHLWQSPGSAELQLRATGTNRCDLRGVRIAVFRSEDVQQ
jgi:hypothetical protein